MSDLNQSDIAKKRKRTKIILVLLLLNILIPGLLITSSVYSLGGGNESVYSKRHNLPQPFSEHEVTTAIISQIQNEIVAKKEELKRNEERVVNIAKAEALLSKYNSPMKGYAEIIVRAVEECGGDYKVLLGIAGNESGFGRIPYKLYNPFGYLDGVQYSGWEESLRTLSCKIARQYLVPCNNDLSCIIVRYGGTNTNKPKWISNVQFFINQIK